MANLAGKVAIVTGAAGGIGLAIARRFAADGASVVLADIQAEKGEAEAAALLAAGHAARFVACDTTDPASVEAFLDAAEAAFGPVGIAVCSAGISRGSRPFHEIELADLELVLKVNLIGPFLVGKVVANRLVASGAGGSIINISSVGAVLAVAESTPYCVSKGGLAMLTKCQALSLAPHGIRVNAIGPGPTDSPLTAHLSGEARAMMISRTPLGRFGTAEEIAGVAAFLASEDAAYVTGQTIYADGGRLALNYVMKPPAMGR